MAQDVADGLADFLYLSMVDEINLLLFVVENIDEEDTLSTDVDQLNAHQQEKLAAVYGFLRIPELYDRALGTEWKDEISEHLSDVVDELKNLKEEDSDSSEK